MSRSRRKSLFIGVAAKSDKLSKQKANRKFRRHESIALSKMRLLVTSENPYKYEPPFNRNQVDNIWAFAKDGKMRISRRFIRDNPVYCRKMLKK